MSGNPRPLSSEALDAALNALLTEYPTAFVAAINDNGLFVPMPASVPLRGQRVLEARSMLDFVVSEDLERVISTWERARLTGASSAQIRLERDPTLPAVVHYVDARARHGVFVGVVVGGDAAALASPEIGPASPRMARVRKNEVAVLTDVDEAITKILGWTAPEMVGLRSLDFVHPEDHDRAIESWMQMLSEPGTVQPPVRLRHRRSDGSWAWFEVTNHNRLGDRDGGYVLAEMIDISDEMAAQEALREREHLLRVLAEALPIGVFEVAPDLRIVYANERLRRILGTGPATTADEQLSTVSPAYRPELDETLRAAVARGVDGDIEVEVGAPRDGGRRRCLIRVRALADERGAAGGALVCVEDVTAARAADEELRRLGAAVEHSADTVVISDLEGRVVYVNPAFERAVGYRRDELVGQPPELTAPVLGMSPADPSIWTALDAGRSWSGTLDNRRKDGTEAEFDVLVTLVRDGRGVPIGSVGVGRDLTRERALEAQVRQAQKMEAVGHLAGGIAHDFNNLLTVIRGYAELHLASHPSEDPDRADVVEIERAAERAAGLTRQLLAFSRRQPVRPDALDLGEVVAAATPLLTPLLGERIELVISNWHEPLRVFADRGQLEQVLLNLATNARDAMPDDGRLTLETASVMLDGDFVKTHAGAKSGPHFMLAVSDTGAGMDEETLSHVFEPFYTTKEPGKGTGLGLASVYGIVKQAAGYIYVESQPGRGTTFRIYLPALPSGEAGESSTGEEPAGVTSGRGTILLVEDEPGVRAVAVRSLERHGYVVLPFGDPRDALAFATSHPNAFDAVVTDVVMPGMSGPILADRLTETRPGLRVLFMSGYDPDGRDEARQPLVSKPFTGDGLAAAVHGLLGPDGAGS